MDELKKMLGDEKFEQVKELLGEVKVIVDNGEYVPKKDYIPRAVFNEKSKELSDVIAERDKQLADLSKKAQGNDELTAELNKLREANEQTAKEAASKLRAAQINHITDISLRDAMCIDPDLFKTKIDQAKFEGVTDESTLKRLADEQVKALKEADKYKPFFGEIKTVSPGHESGTVPTNNEFFTQDQVKGMTEKQLSDNWEKVQKSMKKWSE